MSLNVLILEDRKSDVGLVVHELKRSGYDISYRVVDSEKAYLEELNNLPDIILADYNLPQFDAPTALRHLKEKSEDIPFIIVTGSISEEVAVESIKQGAADYLLKDRLSRLGQAVARALEERRLRESNRRAEESQRFLAESSKILSSSLDFEEIVSSIAGLPIPKFSDLCIVHIKEDDEERFKVYWEHSDKRKQKELENAVKTLGPKSWRPLSKVIDDGQAMLLTEASDLQVLSGLQMSSAISVPMKSHGTTFGSITVGLTQKVYNQNDLNLFEDLAHRAALAIDNARLYKASVKSFNTIQEVSRLKDEFLATVSHELRTPLTSILGWARMLRTSGRLSPDIFSKAIESIERNAEAQTKIVNDLLQVSEFVTGKASLDIQWVDLGELIDTVIKNLTPAARAKNIGLNKSLDHTSNLVLGDSNRLQQMIWNLLSNAVKYTPEDGRVEIKLSSIDGKAQIVVEDSGIGIKPEILPHMFERFMQADSSITRKFGGLGLGLAIVRHIAELHGGTVEVQSAGEGKGARFTVRLPIKSVQLSPLTSAPEMRQRVEAGPVNDLSLQSIKIVVVEDDPDTLEFVSDALRSYGATVSDFSSPVEALEKLQSLRADILVSDIGMPEIDGYEFIRQVRSLSEDAGGKIPAIALTAYARTSDRSRALFAGYQRYITKPIDPNELVKTITNLLRKKESA
jgi:signal transduction histidine kinase/CheY-like chemotaxis protein